MHKFLVIIERAGNNFSAYSPDLPGCVATGDTREEEDGLPIPDSESFAEYVLVKAS